MSEIVGVMGGTFNPIHFGHLIAGEEALNSFRLDKVLFIPNFTPPHKIVGSNFAGGNDRFNMLKLAIKSNPKFEASDIELRRGGLSYSIDTVDELLRQNSDRRLVFITGADAVLNNVWSRFDELLGKLEFFVAVSRPGSSFIDLERKIEKFANRDKIISLNVPGVDISSTDIRTRIKEGKSIRYLVPDEVREYICANMLYD